jgi:hypothetical protein
MSAAFSRNFDSLFEFPSMINEGCSLPDFRQFGFKNHPTEQRNQSGRTQKFCPIPLLVRR